MTQHTKLTPKEILDNKAAIVECAQAFRYDANRLMKELSEEFNFSLEAEALFSKEVYGHKYNNKGLLRKEWTYFFHGAECRFDNLNTGQIVELIYITKPEFGFLDGFFFFNYMETTDRFKNLASWFKDYLNVRASMDVLADEGFLVRDTSVGIHRNIIAM